MRFERTMCIFFKLLKAAFLNFLPVLLRFFSWFLRTLWALIAFAFSLKYKILRIRDQIYTSHHNCAAFSLDYIEANDHQR